MSESIFWVPGERIPVDPVTGLCWKRQRSKVLNPEIEADCLIKAMLG